MRHELIRRRVMYGLSVAAWLICSYCIWGAINDETVAMRCWMIVTLVIAATLTTCSLLVSFLAPLGYVYRAGYEARDRREEEVVTTPLDIAVGGTPGCVVIPLRPVRHFARSDN